VKGTIEGNQAAAARSQVNPAQAAQDGGTTARRKRQATWINQDPKARRRGGHGGSESEWGEHALLPSPHPSILQVEQLLLPALPHAARRLGDAGGGGGGGCTPAYGELKRLTVLYLRGDLRAVTVTLEHLRTETLGGGVRVVTAQGTGAPAAAEGRGTDHGTRPKGQGPPAPAAAEGGGGKGRERAQGTSAQGGRRRRRDRDS